MNSNEENNNPTAESETFDPREFRKHRRRHLWKIPFVVAAIVLIKSAIVFALWNHLIPDLFHGPEVSYLQALEIVVLAKLLIGFGGRGHFGGRHHFGRGPWSHHHGRKHWTNLTPEEREKLRSELRGRCRR